MLYIALSLHVYMFYIIDIANINYNIIKITELCKHFDASHEHSEYKISSYNILNMVKAIVKLLYARYAVI